MYARTYVRMHVRMYVCMYVCMCVYLPSISNQSKSLCDQLYNFTAFPFIDITAVIDLLMVILSNMNASQNRIRQCCVSLSFHSKRLFTCSASVMKLGVTKCLKKTNLQFLS